MGSQSNSFSVWVVLMGKVPALAFQHKPPENAKFSRTQQNIQPGSHVLIGSEDVFSGTFAFYAGTFWGYAGTFRFMLERFCLWKPTTLKRRPKCTFCPLSSTARPKHTMVDNTLCSCVNWREGMHNYFAICHYSKPNSWLSTQLIFFFATQRVTWHGR